MLSPASTVFNLSINCIQSDFRQCKFNNLKQQTKRLLALNNIETNKINKKQRKMNLTHMIFYKFLNVNILLTLISSSVFNVAIYVGVFATLSNRII